MRSAQAHLQQFEALRTYAAVPPWDRRAAELADALKGAAVQTMVAVDRATQEADLLQAARMKRFFLVRLFISKRPELAKRAEAARANYLFQGLESLLKKLLECIDYTPSNDKERKALLKELRLERKELRLEKRDVNAIKRDIHRSAKEASAQAGQVRGWLYESYNSTLATVERREIRRDRYSSLAPFEDKARAIEWQLREVERRLLWVERFGTDE
jgi:hypothetical protein